MYPYMKKIPYMNRRKFPATAESCFSRTDGDLYLISDQKILPSLYLTKQPFRIRNGYCVRALYGEAEYRLDLMDYRVRRHDILLVPEDSILEITAISEDFSIHLFSFYKISGGHEPRLFHVGEAAIRERLDHYFHLMEAIVRDGKRTGISHLQQAYLEEISRFPEFPADGQVHRHKALFNRFLGLVKKDGIRERTIKYYADQLCISPNWLSKVVKTYSGMTVLQWILRTVIQQAKIRLVYSDDPVYLIADELGFSSSFDFSRCFKRETGETPTRYRSDHRDSSSASF